MSTIRSRLNHLKGETVPNLVMVDVGWSGSFSLYDGSAASTQVIANLFGYVA